MQLDSRWTAENHLDSSGVHLEYVGQGKVLRLSAEPSPLYSHLCHMVVLNRGGLEGGPKAKKLVSSSISTTNPSLLSVLASCRESRL